MTSTIENGIEMELSFVLKNSALDIHWDQSSLTSMAV